METVWAGRLKTAILLPFALVLFLLTSLFGAYIYQRESHDINAHSAASFAAAERTYQQIIQTDTQKISAVLDMLVRDPNLRQAFVARDHAGLLQQSQVLLEQMKLDYGISHLYFVLPDRTAFLRVHEPQKFGDRITHQVMLDAEKKQVPVAGLELGKSGRFSLRVAYPWYEGSTLLGYIELAEEIDHLLQQVSMIHQLEVLFLVNKQQLNQNAWIQPTKLKWDWLPNKVVLYSSVKQAGPELRQFLQTSSLRDVASLQQADQHYRLKNYPVKDVAGLQIGELIWVQDTSQHVADKNTLLGLALGFGLLLVLFLMGMMSWLLVRVNQKISSWQQELDLGSRRLRAIFESSPDALMLLDQNGFFECNQRTIQLFGLKDREQFIQTNPAELSPECQPDGRVSAELANQYVERAMKEGVAHFEWLHKRQDNSLFPAEVLLSAFDYGGRTVLQATVRDITERQRLVQQVMHNELLWSAALEGAGDSVWDWNVLTGEVSLSKAGARMFGYGDEDPIHSIEDWFTRLSPMDRERWQKLLRDFFRNNEQRFALEYQVRCKDGSWKWILTRGTVAERTIDGKVLRMVGVHTDIHLRKMAEERVRLFASIFNVAERGLMVVDDAGQLIHVNPAAERMFIHSAQEMVGKHYSLLFGDEALPKILEFMEVTAQGQSWDGLLLMRRADGSTFLAASSIAALLDEQGEHRYWFNIFYDYSPELARQQELQQARDRADAANQSKSEFLANMSHEIRTPMNAIIGLSYLTLETQLDHKQRDNLQKIYHASQLLLGIINDILDFSKIEAGKLELEQLPFTLDQLFANLITIVGNNVRQKHLQLIIDIAPDVADRLEGDALRLGQVLINLVGNAVKFTNEGEIVVRVNQLERQQQRLKLQFEVSDSGIGMGAEQLTRLFQAFSQADSSITRRFGGTGLGLTISKRLVEMMGGTIEVSSTEQVGTTFCFEVWLTCQTPAQTELQLPALLPRQLALRVDEQDPAVQVLCRQLSILGVSELPAEQAPCWLVDWRNEADAAAALSQLAQRPRLLWLARNEQDCPTLLQPDAVVQKPLLLADLFNGLLLAHGYGDQVRNRHAAQASIYEVTSEKLAGAHLLLVEDNAVNQQIAQELLHKVGVSCVVAENGLQALDCLLQHEFDGVLMDIQMPVMDGITAVQEIRRQAQYAHLPVIALTANSMSGDQARYLSIGFNDFVGKPFNPVRLFEVLSKWVIPAHPASEPVVVVEEVMPTRLPELTDVDVVQGVERVGGSLSTYYHILRKFADGQEHTIESIREVLAQKDWAGAQRMIHTLKGLSGSIGANSLFELCKTLENAIRAQDEFDIQSTLPLVAAAFYALLIEIRQLLDQQQTAVSALAPAVELDTQQLALLQQQLRQQLQQFDAEAEQTLRQLMAHLPSERAEAFKPILNCIEQYDFDQALSLLSALI